MRAEDGKQEIYLEWPNVIVTLGGGRGVQPMMLLIFIRVAIANVNSQEL